MWSRLFNDIIFSSWAESLSASILPIVEFRYEYTKYTEAEFLEKIQTAVLRVFLLAIHSHLYSFALRFLFLQTHATADSFLQFSYCNL
jgi:hypothetical protein